MSNFGDPDATFNSAPFSRSSSGLSKPRFSKVRRQVKSQNLKSSGTSDSLPGQSFNPFQYRRSFLMSPDVVSGDPLPAEIGFGRRLGSEPNSLALSYLTFPTLCYSTTGYSICFLVIGYSDTDVAEYIYKSKHDLVSLVNHLCKDLTDACTKNPPPVPKEEENSEGEAHTSIDHSQGEAGTPQLVGEQESEAKMQCLENQDGSKVLPFEFVVLEACLESK